LKKIIRTLLNALKYRLVYNPLAETKYKSLSEIPLAEKEADIYEYYIEVLKYLKSLEPVQQNKKLYDHINIIILFIFSMRFNKKLRTLVKCNEREVLLAIKITKRLDEGLYHLFDWRSEEIKDGLGHPITGGFNKGQHLQRVLKNVVNSEFRKLVKF